MRGNKRPSLLEYINRLAAGRNTRSHNHQLLLGLELNDDPSAQIDARKTEPQLRPGNTVFYAASAALLKTNKSNATVQHNANCPAKYPRTSLIRSVSLGEHVWLPRQNQHKGLGTSFRYTAVKAVTVFRCTVPAVN